MSGSRPRRLIAVAAGAAVLGLLAVRSCADPEGSHGVDPAGLDEVELNIDEIHPHRARLGSPVAVNGVLVASVTRRGRQSEGVDLVSSTDRGATWEAADLPGQPEVVDQFDFRDVDGALAVFGDLPSSGAGGIEARSAVYLWVSSDGIRWQGGRIAVPRPTGNRVYEREIWQLDDGALVATLDVTIVGPEQPDRVVQSRDGGRTWQPAPCPDESRTPEGCRPRYEPERVGRLWIHDDPLDYSVEPAISTDSGRTWHVPELPGIDSRVSTVDAVELQDGGWLVLATTVEGDSSDIGYESHLFRVDENLRWQRGFDPGSRCRSAASESISPPVALGDGWLVGYGCGNPEDGSGPELSRLYLLDAHGENPLAVAGSESDSRHYGEPTVVGDQVLVPTSDFGFGYTSLLLWLRP